MRTKKVKQLVANDASARQNPGAKSLPAVAVLQRKSASTSPQSSSSKGVVQLKGRINTTAISSPEVKKEVEEAIALLRLERRKAKLTSTKGWVGNADGSKDAEYNSQIEAARKKYEEGIKGLVEKHSLQDAFITGDAYYGTQQKEGESTPLNIFKREDGKKKEYVKDMRGTFVPRYVRRELNQADISKVQGNQDLEPTGVKTYNDLLSQKKVQNLGNIPATDQGNDISWPHREFMQQSRGGGGNQIAFSHTSTKRPILSNDHASFGTFDNGAILTDLSKIKKEFIGAQWKIDSTTGHKVKLDKSSVESPQDYTGKTDRRETTLESGYRNMEILTKNIPDKAIVKRPTDTGWGGSDVQGTVPNFGTKLAELKVLKGNQKQEKTDLNRELSRMAYGEGLSRRGDLMTTTREDLEKEVS